MYYAILDDEPDFLEIAEKKLNAVAPDLEGIFLSDPDEFIALAEKDHAFLAILDINLGSVTGIEIYSKIRSKNPRIRAIFITGDPNVIDNKDSAGKFLKEGGMDFILKPVKWHELALKIKNHLEIMSYELKLEEMVRQRTKMLVHADRLITVGTMVSSIIHEFSSPLTFIKVNQQTMLKGIKRLLSSENSHEDDLKFIEGMLLPAVGDSVMGIERIESLLKTFRKFYKEEKKFESVDVKTIVDEARMMTVFRLKKFQIRYEESFSDNDIKINCDKQEIVQVLTNLINNAIDAIEDFGVFDNRIAVNVIKNDKNVSISVENSGPAIPEEIEKDIFAPFFTTKEGAKGTGLGLMICKQILMKSGGDIVLVNKKRPEDMLKFVATLPLFIKTNKRCEK